MRRAHAVLCFTLSVPCAACSHELDGKTPAVEAPTKGHDLPVDPGIVCGEQLRTEIEVHGSGFSPVPIDLPKHPRAALPDLTLTRTSTLDGDTVAMGEEILWSGDPEADPSNAYDKDDKPLLSWSSQESMTFVVIPELQHAAASETAKPTKGPLDEGIYDVTIDNPTGKSATSPGALAVVHRPMVEKLEPTLLCLQQGSRSVALTGTGLLTVGDARPAFEVEGADDFDVETDTCIDIAHAGLDAAVCEEGTVELAKDALSPELYTITVRNPQPAACFTTEDLGLRVVPAPSIDTVTPSPVCVQDVDLPVVIAGGNFLRVDDTAPTVSIDDTEYDVQDMGGCATLETPGLDVEGCDSIDLGMILEDVGVGTHDVKVENPAPASCDDTAMAALEVYAPPVVDSLGTEEICSDQMETVVVIGAGFRDGARVWAGDLEANAVEVVDDTQLEATFDDGLPVGTYDISVQTGMTGCIDTLEAALTVDPSPLVFFVDPPVIYNGISLVATIFTSGLTATASKVELVDDNGDATELSDFESPQRANRIEATIPAGLDPGQYELRVTSMFGCAGSLPGGIDVTGSLDLDIDSVDPAFVSPTSATAVTVLASGGLVATPRVYLNPESGGIAVPLRAVLLADDSTLTAVVPAGLDPDDYSLIVVNPTGEVGVLDASMVQALTVTGDEPPVIDSVVPASMAALGSGTVTLSGSGFDTGGVEVVLDCLLADGTTRTTIDGTAETVDGTGTSVTVSVDLSAGAGGVDPDQGSVCLVRLTNADGAFYTYSAFSVTGSSYNLSAWDDGPDLVTPRRGLSLVAGRPTGTSRFLYAIGGDEGGAAATTRGAVLSSVESASVDVFGRMKSWTTQRNALPAGRTQAGSARIGRFVYMVGGHDGTSATDTLLRAQILDPLAAPQIVDLDATLGDGSNGLGRGLWLYRVSAVFPADDGSNPGGEALAGEIFSVQLPDRDEGILLTLDWEHVPGASGYRVYRSPAADAAASELELLAEVDGGDTLSFIDDGGATDSAGTPLRAGSLGKWHTIDGARCSDANCALGTPREGLVTVAVRDRLETSATTDTYYLYAVGGRDDGGAYLDTIELAVVTVTLATASAPEMQTVADFIDAGDTLSSPRADLGAWLMNAENSSIIRGSGSPNDQWLYLGSGRTTGDAFDRGLEGSLVGSDGTLTGLTATDQINGDLMGLGCGMANDQLYTFGGQSTSDGSSAKLCDGGGGCTPLPDLQPGAFNSLAEAATRRMFMGYAQESAFFFLAGGHSGTATLSTTEQTVQ